MTRDSHTPTMPPFAGFERPHQNWFKLPSNWTDITAAITSLAELKVVEYVLKHTWGYQEYSVGKRITNDEFRHGRRRKDGTRLDKGTGLSKPAVIAGLKAAVAHALLIEEIDSSDRGRVKKYYALRMLPDLEEAPSPAAAEPPAGPVAEQVTGFTPGANALAPGVKTVYPKGKSALPRTEKDPLERSLAEENNNNTDAVEIQPAVVALVEQGLAQTVAERLAGRYRRERITEKIAFLAYLLAVAPQKVKNPQGWLRRAIEEDYAAPDGYQSAAEREAAAAAAARQTAAHQRALAEQEAQRRAEQAKRQAAAAARLAAWQREYGTTPHEQAIWQQVLAEFNAGQAPGTWQADLAGTVLLTLRDGQALIGLPNPARRDWLANRLAPKLSRSLARHLGGQAVTPTFIALGTELLSARKM